MLSASYRLSQETSVVYFDNGKSNLLRLPEGSVVTLDGEPSGERMVTVIWETKLVRMFRVDLQQRGELVEGSVAYAGNESAVVELSSR